MFFRRTTPIVMLVSLLLGVRVLPGGAQVPPVRFTDITAQAGISFRHVASPEKKYLIESMSGGVAMFDYDNDGWQDLYFVNSLSVDLMKTGGRTRSALYHNNGDGTFTDVTDKAGVGQIGWGMGVAVGDYNNDGFDDLYVTCFGGNHLFKNNGDGTFTDVTERAGVSDGRWSTGAAFVDYDNDGRLDIFVANYVEYDLNHLPEFGKDKTCMYKGVAVQCGPRGMHGSGDSLFHNNGDGTFTEVSKKAGVADAKGYFGMGVLCSDLDDDGLVDIYVANDSTPNYLYHNNGDGTFKDLSYISGTALNADGAEQGSMGVAIGDYDHDGRFDIFITNFVDDYDTLYHNDGRNFFTDVSYKANVAAVSFPLVRWGTKFFDYDNDGWQDLFVACGQVYPQLERYRQRKLLHHNNRNGTFTEVAAQSGAPLMEERAGRGVAFGDIDNDGDVDMVINDLDGPPQVLRNDGGNANNSILIRTIGDKSNRDGIGAKVKVVAGDLTQIDEVRSGGSYISQSDMRLHFGLEKRAKIDLIEIRWPSGVVDKITNASVNKILTVKEGKGLVEQKEFKAARGDR
ncbi:MAG TPA: CRTAC1 family protein [Blastocatellia bacterium]|nr:CRTAC1 family protein [Blastocatellia bacterium]